MEVLATTDSVKFSPYYSVCEDSMNPNQAEGEDEILQRVMPFETGSLFEQKKAALKFIGERLLYITVDMAKKALVLARLRFRHLDYQRLHRDR